MPLYVIHAFGELLVRPSGSPDAPWHLLVEECADGFIVGLPRPCLGRASTPASRVWNAALAALEEGASGRSSRVHAAGAADLPEAFSRAVVEGPVTVLLANKLEYMRGAIDAEFRRQGRNDVVIEVAAQQRLAPTPPPSAARGFAVFSRSLDVVDAEAATAIPASVGLRCAAAAWGGCPDVDTAYVAALGADDDAALQHALAAAASADPVCNPSTGPYMQSSRRPPLLRIAVTAGLVHAAALWRAARAEALRCAESLEHSVATTNGVGSAALLAVCIAALRWLTAREYAHAHMEGEMSRASQRKAEGVVPSGGRTEAVSSRRAAPGVVSASTACATPPPFAPLLRPELSLLPWASAGSELAPAPDAREASFLHGLTGFPLVDAAVRCLRATGAAPIPLCALLSNFYCKYLGLPFARGAAALRYLRMDSDDPCSAVQWQWDTGLSAGSPAALSVDGLDLWHGGEHAPSPESVAARRDLELPAGLGGSLAHCWTRWDASLPPHPHCMGHPAAHEFAFDPDPAGAFVRHWLRPGGGGLPGPSREQDVVARVGLPSDSAVLCGASIYDPTADTEALRAEGLVTLVDAPELLAALGLLSASAISPPSAKASPAVRVAAVVATKGLPSAPVLLYPRPIVDIAKARDGVLAAVMALHGRLAASQAPAAGAASPAPASTAAADGSVKQEDQLRAAFAEARAEAGYVSAWGVVGAMPLLVEEDLRILEQQRDAVRRSGRSGPLPDGWAEIFDDEKRRLRLYMADRPGSHVRSALGVATMPFTAADSFDAFVRLSKYKQWDLTWRGVRRIGRPLDTINDPFYFLADTPPPPYSYVITQRDFCMYRAVLVRPAGCFRESSAGDAVFYRNGAHMSVPPSSSLIRGEALGVVGFSVQAESRLLGGAAAERISPGRGVVVTLATAVDPKGSIPAFLINFVARRTPRMWVDRLTAACERFVAEASRGLVESSSAPAAAVV